MSFLSFFGFYDYCIMGTEGEALTLENQISVGPKHWPPKHRRK